MNFKKGAWHNKVETKWAAIKVNKDSCPVRTAWVGLEKLTTFEQPPAVDVVVKCLFF